MKKEYDDSGRFSQIRTNMMDDVNYQGYCGAGLRGSGCSAPRTRWDKELSQNKCPECGWVTSFPKSFISRYKLKHSLVILCLLLSSCSPRQYVTYTDAKLGMKFTYEIQGKLHQGKDICYSFNAIDGSRVVYTVICGRKKKRKRIYSSKFIRRRNVVLLLTFCS